MSSQLTVDPQSNEESAHPGKKTPSDQGSVSFGDAGMGSNELQHKQRFPPDYFPVLYSDGALSTSHSSNIVKFYLARIDPNMWGLGGSKTTPIMQIVMPTNGFLLATAFFINTIETMINDGTISQTLWDDIKRSSFQQSQPDATERDANK